MRPRELWESEGPLPQAHVRGCRLVGRPLRGPRGSVCEHPAAPGAVHALT